jgi:hypothetical protein
MFRRPAAAAVAVPPPKFAGKKPKEWCKIMHKLLDICMDPRTTKGVFSQPVDPVVLNIPDCKYTPCMYHMLLLLVMIIIIMMMIMMFRRPS